MAPKDQAMATRGLLSLADETLLEIADQLVTEEWEQVQRFSALQGSPTGYVEWRPVVRLDVAREALRNLYQTNRRLRRVLESPVWHTIRVDRADLTSSSDLRSRILALAHHVRHLRVQPWNPDDLAKHLAMFPNAKHLALSTGERMERWREEVPQEDRLILTDCAFMVPRMRPELESLQVYGVKCDEANEWRALDPVQLLPIGVLDHLTTLKLCLIPAYLGWKLNWSPSVAAQKMLGGLVRVATRCPQLVDLTIAGLVWAPNDLNQDAFNLPHHWPPIRKVHLSCNGGGTLAMFGLVSQIAAAGALQHLTLKIGSQATNLASDLRQVDADLFALREPFIELHQLRVLEVAGPKLGDLVMVAHQPWFMYSPLERVLLYDTTRPERPAVPDPPSDMLQQLMLDWHYTALHAVGDLVTHHTALKSLDVHAHIAHRHDPADQNDGWKQLDPADFDALIGAKGRACGVECSLTLHP